MKTFSGRDFVIKPKLEKVETKREKTLREWKASTPRERRLQWPLRLRRIQEMSARREVLAQQYTENFKAIPVDQQRRKIVELYRNHLHSLINMMDDVEVTSLHYDLPTELLPQEPFSAQLQAVDISDAGVKRLESPPFSSLDEILVDAMWGKFYNIQHATPKQVPDDLGAYAQRYHERYVMFALGKLYAATISVDKYQVHKEYEQKNMAGHSLAHAQLEKRLSDKGYFAELLMCSLFSRFCVCLKDGPEPLTALPGIMLTNPNIDQQLKVDMMLSLEPADPLATVSVKDLRLIGLQVSTMRPSEKVDSKQADFFRSSNQINSELSIHSRHYIDASDLDVLALVETWKKHGRQDTPDLLLRRDQLVAYAKKFLNTLPPDVNQKVTYETILTEWCQRYPNSRAAQDVQAGRTYNR